MYSVIIRVKNEERYIGHAIQSCLDFLIKPELLIINDNSKDKSLYIARLFANVDKVNKNTNYCNLRILDIENYTPGKALNLGVNESTNENILILSSHCIIKTFNEELITKNLSDYGVLFGNQIPYYHGKRIRKNYLWSNFGDQEVINLWSNQEDRYFFHNGASIFKRDILLNNPFDEMLAGKEDRYWANHWIKKKNQIIYQPQFAVDHHYTIEGNTWKGIG